MRTIKLTAAVLTTLVVLSFLVLWWTGRPPRRPSGLSVNALYLERGVVPFKLSSSPGDWLDCWFEGRDHVDHCRLTDERGKPEFEDVFVPYENRPALSQKELIFDARRTGSLWTGTYERGTRIPIVYLANGEILLPQSEYDKAKQIVDWSK